MRASVRTHNAEVGDAHTTAASAGASATRGKSGNLGGLFSILGRKQPSGIPASVAISRSRRPQATAPALPLGAVADSCEWNWPKWTGRRIQNGRWI